MRNIIKNRMRKSLRDDTRLTVDFNLRTGDTARHVSPKSRRDGILFTRIGIYTLVAIAFLWMSACEEAKRFEISGNDKTPPGQPIFIDSEPLPGGARVFFRAPADEDILSVEVSYLNAAGKQLRFAASYFTDSLDVKGFGREGEHVIELYAVDRAGNRSTSVRETVTSLEPPVVSVAKSVQVLSSFASILLKWTDLLQEPVYVSVDLSYTQNNARHDHTTIFATYQSETRSIDSLKLYDGEQLSVKVNIRDKYGNISLARDTSIVLLSDEVIDKTKWSLLTSGVMMDGITQAEGQNIATVIDDENEMSVPDNYFITTEDNPWSIIIDLGDRYELSRICTHQRWSGWSGSNLTGNFQGSLYRGDNVLTSNLYGWNETTLTWEWWSRRDIRPPVVSDPSEYTTIGITGDMTFLYPEEPQFSKPTRWLRFEAVNGKYISEITLYGRKAR